jgi:hypothetical protein
MLATAAANAAVAASSGKATVMVGCRYGLCMAFNVPRIAPHGKGDCTQNGFALGYTTMAELLTKTNPLNTRSAVFSACQTYRYRLQEVWGSPGLNGGDPCQTFLMLNPSTADEMADDPTVARCHKRALTSGFARFEVINLFALRSTDPAALYKHANPIGPDNNTAILQCAQSTLASGGQLICAWGNHGQFKQRADDVMAMLRAAGIPLHALKTNKNGSPAHPLYLPEGLAPITF